MNGLPGKKVQRNVLPVKAEAGQRRTNDTMGRAYKNISQRCSDGIEHHDNSLDDNEIHKIICYSPSAEVDSRLQDGDDGESSNREGDKKISKEEVVEGIYSGIIKPTYSEIKHYLEEK